LKNQYFILNLVISCLLLLRIPATAQEKLPTVSVEFHGDTSLRLKDFQLLHFQIDLVEKLSKLAQRKFVLSADKADFKIIVYAASFSVSPRIQTFEAPKYSSQNEEEKVFNLPEAGIMKVTSKVMVKGIVYASIQSGSKSLVAGSTEKMVQKEKLLVESEGASNSYLILRNEAKPLPVTKPVQSSDKLILHLMPDKTWRHLLAFIKQNGG